MSRYISHFISVVVTTHVAMLFFFGFMVYFSGLEQAVSNISGWYEVEEGAVEFHQYNLLHFLAVTYVPAMLLAPIWCLIDWANAPRKNHRTALGKPLADIKL
tara:strand:- start:325 stop:630 length:306 start_codon:yes stop_codon:yes gene_type:complete